MRRPQSNNAMQPTGFSAPLIENLGGFADVSRRLMAGVMSPLHVESMKSPAAPRLKAAEVTWIMRADD